MPDDAKFNLTFTPVSQNSADLWVTLPSLASLADLCGIPTYGMPMYGGFTVCM